MLFLTRTEGERVMLFDADGNETIVELSFCDRDSAVIWIGDSAEQRLYFDQQALHFSDSGIDFELTARPNRYGPGAKLGFKADQSITILREELT